MRRTFAGTVALFVSIVGITLFNAPARAQGFDSRIQEGLKLAPVELTKHGVNPALVGLGSYIVNAQGACNECHTNPPFAAGGDPFAGSRSRSTRLVISVAERHSARSRRAI
jgi:hypothetical protein